MNRQQLLSGLKFWNRKVHTYTGLFLLLFLWVFSFSGLLMNHRNWNLSDFWTKRQENKNVIPVHIPESRKSAVVIESVLSQLETTGEISGVKMWADSLHFTMTVPGSVKKMRVDFIKEMCTQESLTYNWSGKIQTLHTFNGLEKGNPKSEPDWLATKLWRLSMDGIAAGLILLCFSSWIMLYRMKKRKIPGWLVLILGFLCAGYFVFAL